MTIADQARDSAIHCEMVKYAYRQTKDGVVVSFVVHPNDIPAALSISHIGARYVAVLVQIGDDELPVHQPAKETPKQSPETIPARPQPVTDKLPVAAKRDWRELQPAQQAGIRANDIRFAHFLEEEYPAQWREHQDAAECIRAICQVHSRVELGTNHAKRVLWHSLDTHFDAWMLKERVGA